MRVRGLGKGSGVCVKGQGSGSRIRGLGQGLGVLVEGWGSGSNVMGLVKCQESGLRVGGQGYSSWLKLRVVAVESIVALCYYTALKQLSNDDLIQGRN